MYFVETCDRNCIYRFSQITIVIIINSEQIKKNKKSKKEDVAKKRLISERLFILEAFFKINKIIIIFNLFIHQ